MVCLRGLDLADDALTLAIGIVDDDHDRIDALGRAAGRRPAALKRAVHVLQDNAFAHGCELRARGVGEEP